MALTSLSKVFPYIYAGSLSVEKEGELFAENANQFKVMCFRIQQKLGTGTENKNKYHGAVNRLDNRVSM